MYSMINGEIVPAVGIGDIRLNSSLDELQQIIGEDYLTHELRAAYVIEIQNAKIWLLKATNTVDQIMVYGDFRGAFRGIGIGSTLVDVTDQAGDWVEDLDAYMLPDTPGICFQLGDEGGDDSWNELAAPIDYISVYRPAEGWQPVNDHTTRILRRALQLLVEYREGRRDLRSLVYGLEASLDLLEERLPDEFYARWHAHWDELETELALRSLEADRAQAIGSTRPLEERQAAVIAELRALEALLVEYIGGA